MSYTLFLVLGFFGLVVLALLLYLFYSSKLVYFFLVLLLLGVLLFALALSGLVLTLFVNRPIPLLHPVLCSSIRILYPVALTLGTALRFPKERIRSSFVELHNSLTRMQRISVLACDILVLLPHCLQHSSCTIKVTSEPSHCVRCGKCRLGALLCLQEELGFMLAVAQGGTLARKKIQELRPKVVLGVACERDLTSGIQDVRKIPVVGLTNERPFGPCVDTSVDVERLASLLREMIKDPVVVKKEEEEWSTPKEVKL